VGDIKGLISTFFL